MLLRSAMRLSDRLLAETTAFHADADEDAIEMLGAVSPADYQRFLVRVYGFVAPVERALASTRDIQLYLDPRRFRKQDLLRRDLESLHVPADSRDRRDRLGEVCVPRPPQLASQPRRAR